jgi:hypothetical protein
VNIWELNTPLGSPSIDLAVRGIGIKIAVDENVTSQLSYFQEPEQDLEREQPSIRRETVPCLAGRF